MIEDDGDWHFHFFPSHNSSETINQMDAPAPAAVVAVVNEALREKRRLAAIKGKATREAKKKAETEEKIKQARADAKAHEAALRKRCARAYRDRLDAEINELTWAEENTVSMYDQLVIGGAPPSLARAIADDMTKHRARPGALIRFGASDRPTTTNAWRDPNVFTCIAAGCDVKALLERVGFTEVTWKFTPAGKHYPFVEARWDCTLVYRVPDPAAVPVEEEAAEPAAPPAAPMLS